MERAKDEKTVELKVQEGYPQDLGRFKVRIKDEILKYLGIKTSGGIVGLHGRKISAAIARPLFSTDTVKDGIRMDKFVRKNCGVSIGDYVSVKMIKPITAQRISLLIKALPLRVGDFKQILKRKLMGVPVSPGDIIVIQLEKTRIPLAVSRLQPPEFCFVRDSTSVELIEKQQEEEMESIDGLIKRKQLIEDILKKVETQFERGNIGADEFTKSYEHYKEELIFTEFQINELMESKEMEITSVLEEPEDSIFCPLCGVKIPRDSSWCPHCGKKIEPLK
ncbi:MAG: hypothetical protein ACFFCD_02345 [Promethearchaeota archaeon]